MGLIYREGDDWSNSKCLQRVQRVQTQLRDVELLCPGVRKKLTVPQSRCVTAVKTSRRIQNKNIKSGCSFCYHDSSYIVRMVPRHTVWASLETNKKATATMAQKVGCCLNLEASQQDVPRVCFFLFFLAEFSVSSLKCNRDQKH